MMLKKLFVHYARSRSVLFAQLHEKRVKKPGSKRFTGGYLAYLPKNEKTAVIKLSFLSFKIEDVAFFGQKM